VEQRVADVVEAEFLGGYADGTVFPGWAARVQERLDDLRSLVDGANDQGKRVAIYGASTRGGTIWQACGFTDLDFVYAVDRNPEKVGKTMSTIGVPIVSEQVARADRPDYMVVSIWFFRDDIVKREADYLAAGGKLVFPLPVFEVVG
jgi:NDP-4-keto-2,6-dideoxyhexose 3-C-methyltransferase